MCLCYRESLNEEATPTALKISLRTYRMQQFIILVSPITYYWSPTKNLIRRNGKSLLRRNKLVIPYACDTTKHSIQLTHSIR